MDDYAKRAGAIEVHGNLVTRSQRNLTGLMFQTSCLHVTYTGSACHSSYTLYAELRRTLCLRTSWPYKPTHMQP